MSALSKILRETEGNGLMFWCPGCDMAHRIQHGAGDGPRWGWNGDAERPTFTPSILVRYDHWVPPRVHGQPAPENQKLVAQICHSFVTDGRLQFLGDCTHHLAGQTVDMPGWDDA